MFHIKTNSCLFPRILSLYVYYSPAFPSPLYKIETVGWQGPLLDSNNTSHISYAIQCRQLVSCSFDLFWTTLHMYHICSSEALCHTTYLGSKFMGQPLYLQKINFKNSKKIYRNYEKRWILWISRKFWENCRGTLM